MKHLEWSNETEHIVTLLGLYISIIIIRRSKFLYKLLTAVGGGGGGAQPDWKQCTTELCKNKCV
jgi:hypothetical protein